MTWATPPVHRVERRLAVFAGLAGFLIAPDDEDPVVGAGGNRQRSQQAHGEGGKRNGPDLPE